MAVTGCRRQHGRRPCHSRPIVTSDLLPPDPVPPCTGPNSPGRGASPRSLTVGRPGAWISWIPTDPPGCVKSKLIVGFRIFCCIEQALDFIHACLPGLRDLLSPELVQACLAETGSVPAPTAHAHGAGAMGHYRDVLVSSVPMALAKPARYPVTRRPAVCRPQRLHPGAPKLADRRLTGVPADRHTLASAVSTWGGIAPLAVDVGGLAHA